MTKTITKAILGFCFLAILQSCETEPEAVDYKPLFSKAIEEGLQSNISYAKGFATYEMDDVYRVDIYQPGLGSNIAASYYLSNNFSDETLFNCSDCIKLPLDSVAVFSATQINAYDKLGLLESIVGVSEGKYINNKAVQQAVEQGQIIELANSGSFYLEATLNLNPQLIFYSPYKVNEVHPLAASKITMIPFFDFLEEDPLGRAEWVKFTAVFYNKSAQADSIFSEIVSGYESYEALLSQATDRPTVFSGKYFNGQWYIPGGQSYISKLFYDSGADYLWSDDPHNNSFPLDYEVVFAKAYDADYWRIVGSYGQEASYTALEAENGLYKHFKAFKEKHIIHCDAQSTAYFETSPLEPHIVLADLIKAFHPELLPNYQPKYYRILE